MASNLLAHGCGHHHGLDGPDGPDPDELETSYDDMNLDHLAPLDDAPEGDRVEITFKHGAKTWTAHLAASATVQDIALICEADLAEASKTGTDASGAEYAVSKFIAPPPVGLLRPDDARTIAELVDRLKAKSKDGSVPGLKLTVMASPSAAVAALRETVVAAAARRQRLQDLRRHGVPAHKTEKRGGDDNGGFKFGAIRPLPHLPQPERALAFLRRLAQDPGIRHIMRLHQYKVGLLTEMDPREYTEENMDGVTRILGLNQNNGQAILLRLRTDVGSGYRDYKTVRLTLCHELAHNEHSDHDSKFWALYRQLVKEMTAADYLGNGGRLLTGARDNPRDYAPARHDAGMDSDTDADYVHDDGLSGGTFVLGSGSDAAPTPGTPSTTAHSVSSRSTPMTERERRAKAAEERLKRIGGGGSAN